MSTFPFLNSYDTSGRGIPFGFAGQMMNNLVGPEVPAFKLNEKLKVDRGSSDETRKPP